MFYETLSHGETGDLCGIQQRSVLRVGASSYGRGGWARQASRAFCVNAATVRWCFRRRFGDVQRDCVAGAGESELVGKQGMRSPGSGYDEASLI